MCIYVRKELHPNSANTQSQLLDQFYTASVNTDSCNSSQKMISDITLSECEGCGSRWKPMEAALAPKDRPRGYSRARKFTHVRESADQ